MSDVYRGDNKIKPVLPAHKKAYPWGLLIDFSKYGNAHSYMTSGFAAAEEMLTWTDGKNVVLDLTVEQPETDIRMTLRCFPFISGQKVALQEIHVYVNHHRLSFLEVFSSDFAMEDVIFDIPRELIPSVRLNLQFFLPLAASPFELGSGDDLRRLGLAIESLCLAPRLAYS